jgi:hypothetical protein
MVVENLKEVEEKRMYELKVDRFAEAAVASKKRPREEEEET